MPAGPHIADEFALTLWQYVEHRRVDANSAKHIALAADTLSRIHLALSEFPGALPSFKVKIEKCRSLLENISALPYLRTTDRAFLLDTYHRILATLDGLPLRLVPIHGDTHLGNVFITPSGALWNDFEDASLGPREWDIAWIPADNLEAFEPINHEVLAVLSDLRSLAVSVWCWEKFEI